MSILTDKHITVAVTGGIAAYKACELVRLLIKKGAAVRCVMTPAATEFVTPMTFAALSGNEVLVDGFSGGMPHLALTRDKTDLLLVAPATANTLAKAASGIADNLVTSLICARNCPTAVAPAMNERMWANPATQRNMRQLQEDGIHVLGPAVGELACGVSGCGRMLEAHDIVSEVERLLTPQTFAGKTCVVTAGPTYEAIDPVRGLTNKSSGRQGYAVAQALWRAGARVVLVSGPVAIDKPYGPQTIFVESAMQMHEAVMNNLKSADIFVGVAAVADWRVKCQAPQKIKKDGAQSAAFPELVSNPDILKEAAHAHPDLYCVGFAAETQNIVDYAKGKLASKGARIIVGNRAVDAFGRNDNEVVFVTQDETIEVARTGKDAIAEKLVALIARDFNKNEVTP